MKAAALFVESRTCTVCSYKRIEYCAMLLAAEGPHNGVFAIFPI